MRRSSKLQPCSTTLLAARVLKYGSEPILVGPEDAVPLKPTDADWERAKSAVTAGFQRAPRARDSLPDLLLACADYCAAQRTLRERRRRAEDARAVAAARVALQRAGGVSQQAGELLRLWESGLLNAPVYFDIDDETLAAIAPYTESGREHEDVSGITALRLGVALKTAGVRAQLHGLFPDIWEVGATIMRVLTDEDVSGERMRKRAGAFKAKLRDERARRARLFSLTPEQILRAPLPRVDLSGGVPVLMEPGLPAYVLFGFHDGRGNLSPPRETPSQVNAWTHIPAHFIPSLEAWHDQLHRKRRPALNR